jgi:hypothetical protein
MGPACNFTCLERRRQAERAAETRHRESWDLWDRHAAEMEVAARAVASSWCRGLRALFCGCCASGSE